VIKKHRYDYILIWGNGQQYKKQIIKAVQDHKDFDVIKIYDHKPESIETLVKAIYSFDYAPFEHLKAKTRYLLTTKPEVTFIFFKNNNTNEDFLGDKAFRHIESLTVKRFKDDLRNQFNERIDGKRTENHVIHATDNQEQTDYILKYLGHKGGINYLMRKPNNLLKTPYHLTKFSSFVIKEIDFDNLYCRIINPQENKIEHLVLKIENSPHYKSLAKQDDTYEKFLDNYQGVFLQDDYSNEKFMKLSEDLHYLFGENNNNFIVVKETELNKYIILDGLHRASILKFRKKQKVVVAVIK